MRLEERLMTIDEIAEWFRVSKKTYQNKAAKKLEELKFYCDFELVPRKGVQIIKIFDPNNAVYIKQGEKNYNIIKEEFPKQWNKNKIDQCSNVAIKIQEARPDLTTKERTTYMYTIKAKKEWVADGRYKVEPCLVKKIGDNGAAVFEEFNEEEQKVINELLDLMFHGNKQKELLILDMYKKGEITSEEAVEKIGYIKGYDENKWLQFLCVAGEKLNCKITRATYLEENGIWVALD